MDRDEVLDCTPRYLQSVRDQYERNRERSEYMLAQLTAVVCNFSMGAPKEQLKPSDFMLSAKPAEPVLSIDSFGQNTPEVIANRKKLAVMEFRNYLNLAMVHPPKPVR